MNYKKIFLITFSIFLLILVLFFASGFWKNKKSENKNVQKEENNVNISKLSINNQGILLAGGSVELVASASAPVTIYLDPTSNFSTKLIDLKKLNINSVGLHKTESFLLNNQYKLALGTYMQNEGEKTTFMILNNGSFGFDNLKIEFQEKINDQRIRALDTGDIVGDGKEEVVIGTRPNGIVRYYQFTNNKWIGSNIDYLDETVHDLLISDIDGDGKKEIILTTSPSIEYIDKYNLFNAEVSGRILSYKFNNSTGAWDKEIIWEYHKTHINKVTKGEAFEHTRYIFVVDIDGDGKKEIIGNELGYNSGLIVLFKKGKSGYSRQIIEDKLRISSSAFSVSDLDSDNKDEIATLTVPDNILLMYKYDNGVWKRNVLVDNLLSQQNRMIEILYIVKQTKTSKGKILYTEREKPGGHDLYLYRVEQDSGVWNKKYTGNTNIPLGIMPWRFTSALPN